MYDPYLMDALEEAAVVKAERWTRHDEFLATQIEVLHALYLLTARAHGAKNVGEPIRVPRPGDEDVKAKAISPREFALMARTG